MDTESDPPDLHHDLRWLLRARRVVATVMFALTVATVCGGVYWRDWKLGVLGFLAASGAGWESLLVLRGRDPVTTALQGPRETLLAALTQARRSARVNLGYVLLLVLLALGAFLLGRKRSPSVLAVILGVGAVPILWQAVIMLPLLRRARERCGAGG